MARKNICGLCGSATRKGDEGYVNDRCEPCWDAAGIENAHNDGHHRIETDPDCALCVIVPVKIVHAVNSRVRNWKPTRKVATVG